MGHWLLPIFLAVIFIFRFPEFKENERAEITLTTNGNSYQNFGGIGISLWMLGKLEPGTKVTLSGTVKNQLIDNKKWQKRLINPRILQIHDKNTIDTLSYKTKGLLAHNIEKTLGKEANLALGLVFGGYSSPAFISTGLAHLMAASGYNVSLVASMVTKILGIHFGIVSTILYMVVAGNTASVMRAGIMNCLALIALMRGKIRDAEYILLITALLMLALYPELIYDIGFQLSVMATLGMISFTNPVAPIVFTMPLILHYFGRVSVYAPLNNLIVGWLVGPATQLSLLAGIFWPVGYLAWPVVKLLSELVLWLSTWPGSSVVIGYLDWGWVGVYYLGLFIYLTLRHRTVSLS